ncbi:hypothetical protein GTZ78_50500, partial [Streptomyces sp. SID8361]|nr:hypothetical protein [Streptomyces sp. SID8361]
PVAGFHQSMLVRTPAGLTLERLTAGLQTVLDHHDALRMRLRCDGDGTWELETGPRGTVDAADAITRVTDPEELRRDPLEDRPLKPEAGGMVRAVWLDNGADTPGRLLLVAHHLVVDGVSWRIL